MYKKVLILTTYLLLRILLISFLNSVAFLIVDAFLIVKIVIIKSEFLEQAIIFRIVRTMLFIRSSFIIFNVFNFFYFFSHVFANIDIIQTLIREIFKTFINITTTLILIKIAIN